MPKQSISVSGATCKKCGNSWKPRALKEDFIQCPKCKKVEVI